MAGKHRKPRQRKAGSRRRWAPSLAAVAVTATSLTTALTTGATATVSPAVELTAAITPASSTAQIFASSTFFGVDYAQPPYGAQQIVPFFLGPQGIVNAIRRNAGEDNVVLSSGWGAGQTGTALALLKDDPALDDVKLVILDNNTNRAGGGFWTTYWIFAPLLLTSSAPTPSDLDIPVLDVGYDYNINGNAATYPINLFADANGLVAYLFSYAGQSNVQLPDEVADNLPPNGDPENLQPGVHYVVAPDGTVTTHDATGNITYVTYVSDRLPLVKPLLLIPGGKIVADAFEPVLTVLVNAGYKDNQPIPDDPGVPRPMGLIPVKETVTALQQLPGAVVEGVHNVQHDLSSPGDLFTTSNQPNIGTTTINNFASNPSGRSQPLVSKPSTTNPFDIQGVQGLSPARTSRAVRRPPAPINPVRQVIGDFTSGLSDLADSLTNGANKPSNTDTPPGPSPGSTTPSN